MTRSTAALHLSGMLLSTVAGIEHDRDLALDELTRANELAEADALTGLRNRRGWYAAPAHGTERCNRYDETAGIVFLDLDGLKAVNDGRGHSAGDALLRATADLLLESCRSSDVIARTGGDEFAILAVQANHDAVDSLAARISQTLDRTGIAASVAGTTHLSGEELTNTWGRADREMYRHKHPDTTRSSPEPGMHGRPGCPRRIDVPSISLPPIRYDRAPR